LGLIKKKGKGSIFILSNAKFHRRKRAQSLPGNEGLQAGSCQSQISAEEGPAPDCRSTWGVSNREWKRERGIEAVLLPMFLALLTLGWPNRAELRHPYFKSAVELFRKQPNKS